MKGFRKIALLAPALCLCGLAATAPAAAAEDLGADAGAADSDALGTHQKNVRLELGARTQFVNSAGLDPFATNDVLGQLSLAASYAFWAQDRLSLAAVVGFDYGASSASARSDQAKLDLRRFTLAPEARYHVLRVLALTGKVGPTLTREAVEVSGGVDTMSKSAWKFGFDATVGAALPGVDAE